MAKQAILQSLRGITPDCTGDMSSEDWVRQRRDSGVDDAVAENLIAQAKTIERCRRATVAFLKKRQKQYEDKIRHLRMTNPDLKSLLDNSQYKEYCSHTRLIYLFLDYFRRPARYEAMVRRSKDA